MQPTRRNFVGILAAILGWTFAPTIAKAITKKTPQKPSAVHHGMWVEKSERWWQLEVGGRQFNLKLLRKRGDIVTSRLNPNDTFPWYEANQWMLLAGSHHLIICDDLSWIKGQATWLVADILAYELDDLAACDSI